MIERLQIQDDINAERVKKVLLELQAENNSILSSGLAIAEAKAQAEADEIKAQAEVDSATLRI